MNHVYRVNEGSTFSPLSRGPVTYQGTALDLSAAVVSVRVVLGSESVIAWEDSAGEGVGDADGLMQWTMPILPAPLANGTYRLWWKFERTGEEPCIIGPDTLQILDVP